MSFPISLAVWSHMSAFLCIPAICCVTLSKNLNRSVSLYEKKNVLVSYVAVKNYQKLGGLK